MKQGYTGLGLALLILISSNSYGTEENPEEINVIGVRQRLEQAGLLKDVIQKTEIVSRDMIEKRQAASLAEAIQLTPGVRVSNECSMCGVKRVMLNGMKGEHTTILVDGVPAHTLVSGFYGIDAAATAGVERIEIARGAGASLIAPEAIGGTINIISREAVANGVMLDLAGGDYGYRKTGLVATGISHDGNTRATVTAQYDRRDQFDADKNGVNESPFLQNSVYALTINHDASLQDSILFRLGQIRSEVFGGPMLGDVANSTADALGSVSLSNSGGDLFEGGDVRNRYIGRAWETTEWIQTEREEIALSWLHEVNGDFNFTMTGSRNEHVQDSFYEGIDYYADDKMNYFDVRFNYRVSGDHLLTFGADHRDERMRSKTDALSGVGSYVSDSFDYNTQGVYMQDTWTPGERFEIAAALRFDRIEADFVDPAKPGVEISESLLSPRVDMRWFHDDRWTSRVSVGRGYRAPLSFFETDHGMLDTQLGYLIDVEELERSLSTTYALSFEGEKLTGTLSFTKTEVENLAQLSETDDGVPLLTQLDEEASVTAIDLVVGYKASDNLSLSFSIEHYKYNDVFKESFAIAPIEQRAVAGIDWHLRGWEFVVNANWIAGRDLTDYGYEGYNRSDLSGIKSTDAPAYYTVDLRIEREINESFALYLGASNLFDYTQAGDEDTPLFYDADGGYGVGYIYGPARGRETYAGTRLSF